MKSNSIIIPPIAQQHWYGNFLLVTRPRIIFIFLALTYSRIRCLSCITSR